MKVYAGCFVDGNDPENLPTVFVCTTEQALVDKLIEDMGQCAATLKATTLDELNEKLYELMEDDDEMSSYSGISWTVEDVA